ncbi:MULTISPECIES: glutamate 5-kinase [Halobacteriovorax]|uniref:Glutamate 5-kinase n=1 Tax=Halobacteriovorax vibrionivorans TaxID=2152716 RepID=A0ABY0IEX1_9BACT|nr:MULTISPECIES: glutamate 5-kinase [Halobacteriovorax]AYF43979.1 glutamate 5-kinase [Halobacteriovorax sp. BALOs_7]RZF21493.1 glutamate 5-kinase [Halobacteriovorax vibrionivorans]TGD48765.1 glutamate 5-kinase [Halobacteriovorax sp. Y22]
MRLRKELQGVKRIVVKVGSNVITKKNGNLDTRRLRKLVEDISELIDSGIEVVLVSSGAVSVGKSFLKKHLPRKGQIDLQHSASAIGQPKLINTYSRLFEENEKLCSQILLTHDDFRNRKRNLHAKQNINVLLKNNITPILNENDSISFTEIALGDNDHLAAQTAQMINADALLMITSTNGLYDKDPGYPDAKRIAEVPFGSDVLDSVNFQGKTAVGKGGMESKVHAVTKITPLGIKAIISSLDADRIILDPLTKDLGTYFAPKNAYDPEERKAWLLSMKKPNCYIEVDRGAYKALKKSKSLLPKGIIDVYGEFYKGDCVDIICDGEVFASGVCEYGNTEVEQIKGRHSDEIEDLIGFRTSIEVIHTINLILEHDIIKENKNERIS